MSTLRRDDNDDLTKIILQGSYVGIQQILKKNEWVGFRYKNGGTYKLIPSLNSLHQISYPTVLTNQPVYRNIALKNGIAGLS